jgi:hypothetical protein
MNTMVSAASIATAAAVATPSIATAAPTGGTVSFPELAARFLALHDRWKDETWKDGASDREYDDLNRHLGRVAAVIVNQPPNSLCDLGWQAEAILTWADDFETIEEDDDVADRMLKTLLANIRSLAGPLSMLPGIVPATETVDPIFAAIEAHRGAAAVWDAALDKNDEAKETAAHDRLVQAGVDLLNTGPATVPGIITAIQYMRAQMLNDGTYMPHHLKWDGVGDAKETKAWIDAFLATMSSAIASSGQALNLATS